MRTVIAVQARMGSSRLPGKVMLPIAGKPLLERMLERLQHVTQDCTLVVATTTGTEDEPIRTLCREVGVRCFDGHPQDLLDRHYQLARVFKSDVLLKIPSDCPLIDPAIVDRVLGYFLSHSSEYDYVSNLHPATYPDGNDVEVMTFDALQEAWKEASKDFEREHTTPFLWERPERFRIGNVAWEKGWNFSMTHRWTIDYPEDYLFVKAVYERLYSPSRPVFALADILDLLRREPHLKLLNEEYLGVNWYRHHAHELRTITSDEFRKAGSYV